MSKEIVQVEKFENAKVHVYDYDGKIYMVILAGSHGIPIYHVFEAEFGVGDDGDGESGPMPYQFVKMYQEITRGMGGHPDPVLTLKHALEDKEWQEEDERLLTEMTG